MFNHPRYFIIEVLTPISLTRVRHSRMLEEGSFRGKTADFFWLLIFAATATLVRLIGHIISQFATTFISSD